MSNCKSKLKPICLLTGHANKVVPLLLAVLLLSVQSGCVSSLTVDLGMGEQPTIPVAGPQYKVIIASRRGAAEVFKGAIPAGASLTIQDALEASGVTQGNRAVTVKVARIVPETGVILKMPIKYDVSEKYVAPEDNYAIHPGDEILVQSLNADFFEAAFGLLTGD